MEGGVRVHGAVVGLGWGRTEGENSYVHGIIWSAIIQHRRMPTPALWKLLCTLPEPPLRRLPQ